MVLAPGVTFDEAKHEYWYKGKKLSGITGTVSKKLGLKYNSTFVGEHTDEGIHVHKAVQRWIETGNPDSVHPGVQWLVETFRQHFSDGELYSEVLVSDFSQYASAVDIILDTGKGGLILFDIKKGKFNREYVTWQLSIYKHFIESMLWSSRREGVTHVPMVRGCVCICLKDKEYYDIFPKEDEDIDKLLYNFHVDISFNGSWSAEGKILV